MERTHRNILLLLHPQIPKCSHIHLIDNVFNGWLAVVGIIFALDACVEGRLCCNKVVHPLSLEAEISGSLGLWTVGSGLGDALQTVLWPA